MAKINALNQCPKCNADQLKRNDNGTYTCRACDSIFSAEQIERNSQKSDNISEVRSAAIRDIDSPNSALIYLDTFFDSYDWEVYADTDDIYIEDLQVMVEKNKIKNPDNPKTWELEAKSIGVPVENKLDAINALQEKICREYNGDIADVSDELAKYNSIAKGIVDMQEKITKLLECDVANMKRFGAEKDDVAAIEKSAEELKARMASIKIVEEVEELPVAKKIMAENEAIIVKKYADLGINAVEDYKNGITAYKAKHYSAAIAYFDKIKDYRDSVKYISLMQMYFLFGEIVEAGGKTFKLCPHKQIISTAVMDKKGCALAKKKEEPAAPSTQPNDDTEGTWDLYEIVNKAPAETPSIVGVSEIVKTYGDNIYYIKGHKEFCVYNVGNEQNNVLDTSKHGYNTSDEDSMGVTFAKDKLYIKKIIEIPAFKNKGCAINKKKKEEEYNKSQQNNYSMMIVDLKRGTISVAVEKMVGCTCLRDLVFFTVSEEVSEDKHHRKTYETKAKMHNFATGKTDVLFEKNCEILAVSGTKVIYDTWEPNSLNREIHAIDYQTKEDVLLEDNVYQFIEVITGKIFYTVGNKHYSPLFSINLDGTERTEILPNFCRADWDIRISNSWIYMWRKNTGVILKVSLDGKEKKIIAADVEEIIKITGTYMYYISTVYDAFRIAKLDGTSTITVATGLSSGDISIGATHVYYLRDEWVGSEKASSLYRMDPDGHNVKKILFNIEKMKDKTPALTSGDLYILKKCKKAYRITSEKNSWVEDFKVSTYYTLNKTSAEMKTILVLGEPNKDNYASLSKSGCVLFKKKATEVTIEELVPIIDYGQLTEEEGKALDLAVTEAAIDNAMTSSSNTNSGCLEQLVGTVRKLIKK